MDIFCFTDIRTLPDILEARRSVPRRNRRHP
jgi:hypothetical protein